MSGQAGSGPPRGGANGVVNGNMAGPPTPRPEPLGGNVVGNPPGTSISQQNLNQIVIEYLSKKGYTRTEAMLRSESGQHEALGRSPVVRRAEDETGKQYQIATDLLINWIEDNLDVYKPELRRLVWPIFVYSYLEMIARGFDQHARIYFNAFKERFQSEHPDDLRKLAHLSLPEHLNDSDIAKIYRGNKYRLSISFQGHDLLIQFLEDRMMEGGSVLQTILQNVLIVTISRATEDRLSLANMLKRAKAQEDFPAEDEGIPGHNPGSSILDQDTASTTLTRLMLGPLEMEPELLSDVLAELDEDDAKNPPVEGQNTLRQEFDLMIKKEPDLEAPERTMIPLPPSKARDVIMEVQKVKENRDRFKIEGKTGGVGVGISICIFTFHNSHDSITCVEMSGDNNLIAVGFDSHYIRVWNADGKPLPSTLPNEQPQASRRLIGHSGPVYALSFSPAVKNPNQAADSDPSKIPSTTSQWLLSCSADKTIRLWHLETWQCLVVYKGHLGPVWDITWGPFGHYFLSASHDKTARLWSTEHISALRIFVGHDGDVEKACFHPNNAYCFTGGADKLVRMWLLSTGAQVRLFTGHTGNITAMACSPSGRILATADDNGAIILWDILPGRLLKRMRGHGKGGIWSISWSVESNVLISGGMDGTVRVWDATKPADAAGQGKVLEGNASNKIDVGAAAQTGKKKGKETVISADQIGAWPTKKTPVYWTRFTRMNLALAAGAYLP